MKDAKKLEVKVRSLSPAPLNSAVATVATVIIAVI